MSRLRTALLIAAPLLVLYVSLCIGRFDVSVHDVNRILATFFRTVPPTAPTTLQTIVVEIRLPRALLALLVGAGLSMSGAAYQGLFRNPLVSPDILGVTSAAGFGAASALLLSADAFGVQVSAFCFGVLGVLLTYWLARTARTTPVLMLVLSGIVVAAFFSALVSGVKFVADPDSKLPAITYWLLGGLNGASARSLGSVALPMLAGMAGLLLLRWRLNLLGMGDEEARALGVRTERMRAIIIGCSTLIAAAAVSVCGMVGWVGLVIPHLARILVGPDHRKLLPASASIGAVYLLLIDDVARSLTASEIPLGVLTALIGAPCFAYLLRRAQGTWR